MIKQLQRGKSMTAKDKSVQGKDTYYNMKAQKVAELFGVDPDQGLTDREVESRQKRFGNNELQEEKVKSPFLILLEQFKSIVILIMVAASLLAFATARWPEALALVAVIIINTAIGFFTEYKAIRSMEALRELGEYEVQVRREKRILKTAAADLVPGDIVLLKEGDLIPADMRLLGPGGCRVNEAALTGESVSVIKTVEPVEVSARLHARTSMLYKGTSVTEGEVEGVVTATGMYTEIGKISKLAAATEQKVAPLQKRLDQLGRRLAWITLAIAALVGVAGVAAGRETVIMVETSIALGIAAIPEGLPIVATIALARGMWLMAKRNALVNRLTAVEALGATSVIFTDKTGTLTENKMELEQILLADGDTVEAAELERAGREKSVKDTSIVRLLKIGVLCSNAKPQEGRGTEITGDPTEVALIEAAERVGITREGLLNQMPEEREIAFDSKSMMMATVHHMPDSSEKEGRYYIAVKGAPGQVLNASTKVHSKGGFENIEEKQRKQWLTRVEQMAGRGLRLLAFADKETSDPEDEVYESLRFVGFVGLKDPPRSDVREAIKQCQEAGIRVVMVTGDRPDTGSAIGEQVGLSNDGEAYHGGELGEPDELSPGELDEVLSAAVFARVTPEQKYNLVKIYQDEGLITAMTGDGINDAPALKQADIGIAMGLRGTDAAKQVADMVLRDDKFSTIVSAVEQGRIIFANIRKSVMFMLITNIAEVIAVASASLMQLPIPLRPLQILYLNVLTDVFPALALGVGYGAIDVMRRPPRKSEEPVLTQHHWKFIGGWSFVIAVCVLGALAIALHQLGYDEKRAVTVSFLTLAFAKLWFVFNLRDRGTTIWKNDISSNRWLWGAWLICLTLLAAAVYWSPLSALLHTVSPGLTGWVVIAAISLLPVGLGILIPGIHFYSTASK